MSKQEAIKTLHELWRETNDPWYEEAFRMAIEALQQEQPQGEWRLVTPKAYAFEGYRCSECNNLSYGRTRFCSECGAQMKGADDE